MSPQPAPNLRVGDAERARAESLLQDAYCAGRLELAELDQRLGQVMTAQTRRDVGEALRGLPPQPVTGVPGMAQGVTTGSASGATSLGGLAHLSGLFTWVLGPLFFYAAATPGTPARREAARAFNFQLTTSVVGLVVLVIGNWVFTDHLLTVIMMLGWVGWLLLTVIGGAKALSGRPWDNPIPRMLRLEVLDPSGR